MAKVSNTDVYNYDTSLDPKDFLLGTNWNNAKKTQSFRLEQIRYFVLQGLDPKNNGFLVNNGFSLVENVLTINAGWQWLLNGLLCSNEDDIEITLEYAAEGFLRIDSIYANSNGEFLVSTGTETETIAIQPAIPVNTLFAFPINIFDSNLQAGEPPVLGNTYVKKSFAKVVEFNGTGTDVVIPLNPDGFSEIRLINSALDSLSGVDLSLMVGANFEAPYQGKPYIFWNKTGGPITIKNEDYDNADLPFFVKEGTDIILPDNEKILFHYDNGGLFEIFRSFSDSFELTETNFGAFSNSLQTEDELSDSDKFSFVDSSDGNKQKKTTWLNVKAKLANIYNALFVPETRTLTIGGVTQDLSENRTFNVGGEQFEYMHFYIRGTIPYNANPDLEPFPVRGDRDLGQLGYPGDYWNRITSTTTDYRGTAQSLFKASNLVSVIVNNCSISADLQIRVVAFDVSATGNGSISNSRSLAVKTIPQAQLKNTIFLSTDIDSTNIIGPYTMVSITATVKSGTASVNMDRCYISLKFKNI